MSNVAVAGDNVNVTSVWIGPPVGQWSDAQNWFPATVPNNAGNLAFRVILGGPSQVGLTDEIAVDELELAINGQLAVPNGRSLRIDVGPIVNDGTVSLLSAGSLTELRINAPEIRLEGIGSLVMSLNGNNRVIGVGGPRRLVNAADHLIAGGGHLGANTLHLTNDGEIVATGGGQAMTIDLAAGENLNRGSIRSFAAPLSIVDTFIDNTDGEFAATNLWPITIAGSTIVGGLLRAEAGADLSVQGAVTALDGVSILGILRQPNMTDIIVRGEITNDGAWNTQASLALCRIIIDTPSATIGGSGAITLSASAQNRFVGEGGVRQLVHAAGHTIRGSGSIAYATSLTLENFGLIEATAMNPPLAMTLAGVATDNRNRGTLRAAVGGRLTMTGTALDNTDGVISALDQGRVELSGSPIYGGTLATQGSGEIRMLGNPSTLVDVTLDGVMRNINNADTFVSGSMDNSGQWHLDSTGAMTDIMIISDLFTLTGDGSLQLSASAGNRIIGLGTTRRLVNGADHTIRGSGQLGANIGLNLTNHGLIVAEQQPGLVIDALNDFKNHGTLRVAAGSALTIAPSEFQNSGVVVVDANASLVRHGALTLTSDSTLRLMLAGDGATAPMVTVNGAATLGGTLHLPISPLAVPPVGSAFTLMSAASIAGAFDAVDACVPVTITVETGTVTVHILGEAGTPDLNGDGLVDGADLGVLFTHWGACGDGCCPADLNGDGTVNGADFGLLLFAWR